MFLKCYNCLVIAYNYVSSLSLESESSRTVLIATVRSFKHCLPKHLHNSVQDNFPAHAHFRLEHGFSDEQLHLMKLSNSVVTWTTPVGKVTECRVLVTLSRFQPNSVGFKSGVLP